MEETDTRILIQRILLFVFLLLYSLLVFNQTLPVADKVISQSLNSVQSQTNFSECKPVEISTPENAGGKTIYQYLNQSSRNYIVHYLSENSNPLPMRPFLICTQNVRSDSLKPGIHYL